MLSYTLFIREKTGGDVLLATQVVVNAKFFGLTSL